MDISQKCNQLKAKYQLGTDAHAFYMRSIIARYEDDYTLEKQLIDQAIKLYPENKYFQERVSWHALPYFEKYEARKTPKLPEDYVPVAQEYRDQLTIVLGGDDNVFYEIYECIESLRSTLFYQNVRIDILDCGLSQIHKLRLRSELSITEFHDAYSLFEEYFGRSYTENFIHNASHLKCHKHMMLTSILESFMPLFIQSQYIFWIESDIWIQDERSMDFYLRQAIERKVYIPLHGNRRSIEGGSALHLKQHPYFKKLGSIKRAKAFEQCFNIYHRDFAGLTVAQKEWKEYLAQYPFEKYMEYIIKNYAYRIGGLEDIDISSNRHHAYFPRWNVINEDNFFIDTHDSRQILGSIHLGNQKKEVYYNQPLEKLNHENRKTAVMRSARYRDLPWKDKATLEVLIQKEGDVL